ncbi:MULTISPECIES: ABC transporter ATP-binding protein [unclassified Sedimentibacter]|uniref:ABC transporter ATP-binding protein n=1 Tax=unclassified Sedimentibacter TaxID=2649220 RepID=UPI0027DFF4EB|nr:ABC transporter ATP-binding protein [Sedimentibacter sp. MB35-C1]WMJ77566.1 ABC transporter ATP-binding protein [Sedimentibacter sp. MB35-C1]
MNESVVLKNLSIKAGEKHLVRELSLNIQEGEIFGLVGESGSGKTLTAKSIINVLPEGLSYAADEMRTAGRDILKMSKNEKRIHIGKNAGYIPQNTVFYLHPMIKIKNQIADGYMYHMKKNKTEALLRASVLLEKVGFDNPRNILNFYPWQLSGGMRQRVNIAMALMNDPKVIIADEPTTALDSTVQRQVMELFKEINKELGISILLISHDLGLVRHYSRGLAVMYAGKVVESGRTEEIFNNPKHPYTQLLMKIIPSLKMRKNEPLAEIHGYVQDEERDAEGCLFIKRCPHATDVCAKYAEEHNNDGHYYRCNLE